MWEHLNLTEDEKKFEAIPAVQTTERVGLRFNELANEELEKEDVNPPILLTALLTTVYTILDSRPPGFTVNLEPLQNQVSKTLHELVHHVSGTACEDIPSTETPVVLHGKEDPRKLSPSVAASYMVADRLMRIVNEEKDHIDKGTLILALYTLLFSTLSQFDSLPPQMEEIRDELKLHGSVLTKVLIDRDRDKAAAN